VKYGEILLKGEKIRGKKEKKMNGNKQTTWNKIEG
jgi:hypothetical protein